MHTLDEVIQNASEAGRPFWTAMAEGRLDLPFCNACQRAFFFPRKVCPNCWSTDIAWVTSAGRGAVFSFTVAHVPFQGVSKEELPFATGLVDLEEGVRVPVRFVMDALPKIGGLVQCSFRAGLGQYPVFLPVPSVGGDAA